MFKKINAELVPLCHENINVTVTNNIAMIKLEQFYFNSNDEFIEAEYIFPSNEQIVFSELQMRFKDNVICTRIEERSIINEVFEIDSGKALAVTTTSQLAKDIEVINLGNIPPKSEIMIECTYFLKLSVEDLSWCLYIPSKIIPKYMGELSNNKSKENEESESSIEKEYREKIEGMSEAVRAYYQNLNFTYDFEIILNSSFQLTRVISTTHNIYTDFVDDKETRAVIRLTDPSTLFDSDFKLLFRNEEINKPIILTQKLGDERALMVSFLADLTSEVDKEKRQASISSKIDIDNTLNYEDYFDSNINWGEYYFVLDRSGSMIGQSIETAKKALILFLRSLPPWSKFNVVSFGTDYKFMFKNAVDYNQEHLESAISEVQKFEADMNGTEIYMPLNQIYSQKDGSSSLDKYVYLLTDGKVENTDEVIKLVKDNSSSFTVHTIGIGASASTSLVVGWANAGKGDYHFVKSKAVGLKTTVIEALSKSYFPYIFIKDQELRWSGNIIDQSNEFKESQIKLVHGDQLTYYAIIDKLESDKLEGILKLNLFNPKINKTELLEYELSTQSMEVEGSTLFKLIANREIIESTAMYDDKFAMKISVNYQVLSNFSSFIVEEKVPYVLSNKVEGEDNAHSSQSVENSISNKLDSLKPTSHKPAYSPLLQYRMTVHIKLLTGNTLDINLSIE